MTVRKKLKEAPVPEAVARAARSLGEDPRGLLAWKVTPTGEIVLILGSGKKVTLAPGAGRADE